MPVFYEDIRDCRASAFGEVGTGVLNLIDQYASRGIEHISAGARSIYNAALAGYDTFKENIVMRKMTAARNTAKHFHDRDIFREMSTLSELQNAKNLMQRGIMSNPRLRTLSRENRIEGYRGQYTDPYADTRPEDHPDYLRLIDGVWMHNESEDEYTYQYTLHDDRYNQDDDNDPFNNLTVVERDWVLSATESALAYYKANKDDPTSKWNASL